MSSRLPRFIAMRPFALRAFLLILALAFAVAEAGAQGAGAFARMGFGARGVALGGALVADGSGEASPYYNPALAPFLAQQQLEAAAAFLTHGRQLQHLQLATPLRPSAGVAAGLIHAGVSGIDGRDSNGLHTGDLATDDFAFFLAFGTRVGTRATLGAGLQLFRSDLYDGVDPVTTIGLDLGLTVQPAEALRVGIAVEDLLARYTWNTSDLLGEEGASTTDRFPTRLRVGGAYTLAGGRARLLAEYESRLTTAQRRTLDVSLSGGAPVQTTTVETLRLHEGLGRVGAEYRLAEPFVLRAGLDGLFADGLAAGARPSAGFMVAQPLGRLHLRAEYAFALEPYGAGALHLLSLRFFL